MQNGIPQSRLNPYKIAIDPRVTLETIYRIMKSGHKIVNKESGKREDAKETQVTEKLQEVEATEDVVNKEKTPTGGPQFEAGAHSILFHYAGVIFVVIELFQKFLPIKILSIITIPPALSASFDIIDGLFFNSSTDFFPVLRDSVFYYDN